MKNSLLSLLPLAVVAFAPACSSGGADVPKVKVEWTGVNMPIDSTGVRQYKQTCVVTGDLRGVERLGFNQFARAMKPVDPADSLVEVVPGYYLIESPRFAGATENDTLVFEMLTRGSLQSICYSPDGFHVIYEGGKTAPVEYVVNPLSDRAESYISGKSDRMPYGDVVYDINERITSASARGVYDVVPSFKQVELTGGETTVNPAEAIFKSVDDFAKTGRYSVVIADGKITITAPEYLWQQLLNRFVHLYGDKPISLPQAQITDWPSLGYRGVMVDISRNYQTPSEIRRVLDLMALYGLNVFHFHFSDDEAWRLEIPALPELTEVGSRRGFVTSDTCGYLPQIFAGDGNPDTKAGTANGYFTRQDYIDMIRHADSLGINVIPEIESPGHARAAIRAMEYRARKTGDISLLLHEPGDTSKYTSAQAFHDNVMNPALEGPYKFMDIVSDEIIAMHKEAGVPLLSIHIGGDEVPRGAWSGSAAVAKLKQEQGLESEKDIHAYFVSKVNKNFAEKGVGISAWQEVALENSKEYNSSVAPNVLSINCWSTLARHGQGKVVDNVAKAGYPVVLSNVNHFYLDMMYSYHPDERGLSWGGWNDEFAALAGYPARLCTEEGANVVGVQGQLFAETIRDTATLERMLLPKILGLAERGWNPDSTYTDAQFHSVIVSEMPKWERRGYAYHVRQAGIKLLDDNTFVVNSPYPDAVVRYSLDGVTPTEKSPEIKPGEAVSLGGAKQIRVRLWIYGHPSCVTILNVAE